MRGLLYGPREARRFQMMRRDGLSEDRPLQPDPTPAEIRQRCREVLTWRERKDAMRHRRKREFQAKLVATLQRRGPMGVVALATALGATRNEVFRGLMQLRIRGEVRQAGASKTSIRYALASDPLSEDGVEDLPSANRVLRQFRADAQRKAVRA